MTPSRFWRVFFRLVGETPIYHCPMHGTGVFKTRCGRKISAWRTMTPVVYARKIGRPCKDCFPGGDND